MTAYSNPGPLGSDSQMTRRKTWWRRSFLKITQAGPAALMVATGLIVSFLGPAKAASPLLRFHPECTEFGPAAVLFLETQSERLGLACGRESLEGPPASLQSRFLIASVSKTFLAVALLQLQDNGTIDLDDAAAGWLPADIIGHFGGLEGLTIAHLLNMTSGLPDYLDEAFYEKSLEQIADGATSREILLDALKEVSSEPRLFPPGTGFGYSNTNYLLAQLILEAAGGLPMHDVFREVIFEPAGLKQTRLLGFGAGSGDFVTGWDDMGDGIEPVSAYHTGYGMGDGGLISTAADIAAFYRALFVDRSLLSDQGLKALLHDPLGEGYGLGIEIETGSRGGLIIGHSGGDVGFSADVRHGMGQGVTVVHLSAQGDDARLASWKLLDAALSRDLP